MSSDLPAAGNLAELAEKIRAEHAACESAVSKGVQHAVNAGRMLLQAKALCGHGKWIPWLAVNFPAAERTAQAYMRVARHADALPSKAQRVADLPLRDALAVLADSRETRAAAESDHDAGNDDLVPAPGHALGAEVDHMGGRMEARIEPSNHDGYFYVSCIFKDGESEKWSIEGTKRPVRQDFIRKTLDSLRFPVDRASWAAQPWEPMNYNLYLFNDYQHYVDRAILGKRN